MHLSREQLTGLVDTHVHDDGGGHALQPGCWDAFHELQRSAAAAGFDLQIVSAFRSFQRQLAIWNAKVQGSRPVHDDAGDRVDLASLDASGKIHAILRYSALPGGSRHHWGTDIDVYDAAAVPADYRVQLTPQEVDADGVFGAFHAWLDSCIAEGNAFGFERPYERDRGGVAPERWHLSYAPLARNCAGRMSEEVMAAALEGSGLELAETVLAQLPEIYDRYICLT